jgi:hypothetical protein
MCTASCFWMGAMVSKGDVENVLMAVGDDS